jgi:predicted porin
MQKKIIALAVAGLASTAAFAQTNVTIYGVADAAAVYTNTNGGAAGNGRDKFAIDSGGLAGSRLGFKGTEDLGNGLKAIFTLEYALSIDANTGIGAGAATGTSALQARQQFVGLSTKAGDVTLGRVYAPGYFTLSMDALAASPALSVVDAAQASIGASIRGTSPSRWNNAVNYKTANWGGFTGQMIYSAGENQNEVAMGESYGIGADYAAGPFAVKYVYQNTNSGTIASVAPVQPAAGVTTGTGLLNNGATQEHYVGASFDLKVVKLMASAQMQDRGNRTNAAITAVGVPAAGGSAEVYQIGAVVPVGKGNIHASYAYADLRGQTRNVASIGGQYDGVSVAYTHGLSKRTTAYTGLRYQDLQAKGTASGAVTTVFAAGINHTF